MAKKKAVILVLVQVLFVGLDQWTKQLAHRHLEGQPPIEFFGGLLTLIFAENTGAFLSLGAMANEAIRFWIFVVGVALFLIYAVYHVFKDPSVRIGMTWVWALVIAGGVGNLIDRSTKGSVTDFLLLKAGPLQTGIFNIADMCILFGIIGLLFWGRPEKDKISTH